MNRISVFGFTGSIGTQALSVIEKYPSKFELDVLVCNKNVSLAIELIKKHNPKNVFVTDSKARSEIMASCCSEINFFDSMNAVREYLSVNKSDIYLSAISSFDCIDLTIDAAKSGKKLLLANKESLVVFGKQIMQECKQAQTLSAGFLADLLWPQYLLPQALRLFPVLQLRPQRYFRV